MSPILPPIEKAHMRLPIIVNTNLHPISHRSQSRPIADYWPNLRFRNSASLHETRLGRSPKLTARNSFSGN